MIHHSVSLTIADNTKVVKNNKVKVFIQYPKDFKGIKFFKDGDEREMALETAEQFINDGFAFYEKPKKADPEIKEAKSDAVKESKTKSKK